MRPSEPRVRGPLDLKVVCEMKINILDNLGHLAEISVLKVILLTGFMLLTSCSRVSVQKFEFNLADGKGFIRANQTAAGKIYFEINADEATLNEWFTPFLLIYEDATGNHFQTTRFRSGVSQAICTFHLENVPSEDIIQAIAAELGISIQISGQTLILEGESDSSGESKPVSFPPANPVLKDGTVYYAYVSDREAPQDEQNILQFEYEAIYAVPAELRYDHEARELNSQRLSPVGKRRNPVWARDGANIAYLDLSKGRDDSRIAVINVHTGTESYVERVHPTSLWGGLSWDESGKHLAYRSVEGNLCTYNFETGKETVHLSSVAEGLAISPDGEYVCFMVREGENLNDTDGWRFKIMSLKSDELNVVGDIDDRFGILGSFYWSHDSSYLLFSGFGLTPEGKRMDRKWYRYTLKTEEIQPYEGDFRDIYDQQYRYWIRP
ncbi:hypothetical protein P3T73_10105 [Kiritimatiellota bacterium B12222]|nr:hypothetical protein P3T73_10105 [Kiritimatiellota bacterium B12222]